MKLFLASFIFLSFLFNHKSYGQVTQLVNNEGLLFCALLNEREALFYAEKDGKLWISNGTPTGTKLVTSKVAVTGASILFNGKVYFQGNTTATGKELWVTDGTDAGTTLVKDIYQGTTSSNPGDRFTIVNNQLFFTARTAASGIELWKTNGTTAGTVLVKDIVAGTASSNDEGLFKLSAAGNLLYFIAKTNRGEEVWKSDGTEAGTVLLKDINPGTASSEPIFLGTFQNKIIFSAIDATHGSEPWISDGTTAGTVLLKDINVGIGGSSPSEFTEFNGKMLFVATDGFVHGSEVWISDGTTAGTNLLKDIFTGPFGGLPNIAMGIQAHGYYYFSVFNEDAGFEIWRTNGTTAGTQLFIDIEAGEESSLPLFFKPYVNGYIGFTNQLFQGNKFFFAAFTTNKGYELYVTDGTKAGTKMVKDIHAGMNDGIENINWYYTSNALYFTANDGINGEELWKTDGTAANTVMVANVNNVLGASAKTNPIVIVNNRLLFTADNGDNTTNQLDDLYVVNATEQVLPIRMNTFTAKELGNTNRLSWTVANAINFNRFEVERSTNGIQFSHIGSVNFTSNKSQYQFDDVTINANQPTYYYRLKLVDADQKFSYSNIIQLSKQSAKAQTMQALVKDQQTVQINYQLHHSKAQIVVTDVAGKRIQASTINSATGYITIQLPKSSNQLFIVSVYTPTEILSQKIIL